MFCSSHFLSVLKPKGDSNIKIFIENEAPIKNNQIHGFVKVPPNKSLPPKKGG